MTSKYIDEDNIYINDFISDMIGRAMDGIAKSVGIETEKKNESEVTEVKEEELKYPEDGTNNQYQINKKSDVEVFDAIQWIGTNYSDIEKFFPDHLIEGIILFQKDDRILIEYDNGLSQKTLMPYDYIVSIGFGQFIVMSNEAFKNIYKPFDPNYKVEVSNSNVSDNKTSKSTESDFSSGTEIKKVSKYGDSLQYKYDPQFDGIYIKQSSRYGDSLSLNTSSAIGINIVSKDKWGNSFEVKVNKNKQKANYSGDLSDNISKLKTKLQKVNHDISEGFDTLYAYMDKNVKNC